MPVSDFVIVQDDRNHLCTEKTPFHREVATPAAVAGEKAILTLMVKTLGAFPPVLVNGEPSAEGKLMPTSDWMMQTVVIDQPLGATTTLDLKWTSKTGDFRIRSAVLHYKKSL